MSIFSNPPHTPTTSTSTGSGITFNLHAYNSVNITGLTATSTGSSFTYELWYNTDSVNGAPTITTANKWVLHETGTAIAGQLLKLKTPLNIPQGETYGMCFRSVTNSVNYSSSSSPIVFKDANLRLRVGSNVGYSGSFPTPTIHPRCYAGTIEYEMACFPDTSYVSVYDCASYTGPSGTVYTTAGIHNDVISNAAKSCDSIVQIDLTLGNTHSNLNAGACNSYTVPSGNQTYYTGGNYTDTFTNAAGCDSIIHIKLKMGKSYSYFIENACNSYTIPSGKKTYTISGIYHDTLMNSNGCDSIMTIFAGVNTTTNSTITENACKTYTVPSKHETYTVSGTYYDTILNVKGCDSIITIDLTINNVETGVEHFGGSLLKAKADPSGATYQWINCISGLPIAGATEQSFTARVNGDYAVIVTENGCTETSACTTISNVGINDLNDIQVSVFPNPNEGKFEITLKNATEHTNIEVYNALGKVIYSGQFYSTITIDLGDMAKGVYLLKLKSNNGKLEQQVVIQ